MPSASLRNRLKALETAQGQVNDDVYWAKVREYEEPFFDAVMQVTRGDITWEEFAAWKEANPFPERGRPLTHEEEREAERAREEFWLKIEQTRERLLSGAARGLFDNPAESKRKLIHDKNGIEDVPQRLAPGRE